MKAVILIAALAGVVACSEPELDARALALTPVVTQYQPQIAYSPGGGVYLIVWSEYDGTSMDVYGRRLKPSGVLLDPTPILISHTPHWVALPAVACQGTQCLVVWHEVYNQSAARIKGARIDTTTGAAMDLVDRDIGATVLTGWSPPAVAWTGSAYLVVWYDWVTGVGYRMASTLVSPAGVSATPGGKLVAPMTYTYTDAPPAIVAANGTALVAYTDCHIVGNNCVWDVRGATIAADGRTLSTFPISRSSSGASGPTAAVAGLGAWVAWVDYRGGSAAIYGTPVTAGVVGPSDVAMITAPSAFSPRLVARSPGALFLTYGVAAAIPNESDTLAAPVSPTGGVGASFPASTAPGSQARAAVATDGVTFGVAWLDTRNNATTSTDVYGGVAAPGTMLVTDLPIRR